MDVLDDILGALNLKGALYFRTDFNGPWAVTVPDLEQAARFHLVVQGQCHVTFQSGKSVILNPGDLVLIPGGRSHVLADQDGREAPALETVLDAVGYDGGGLLAVGDGDETASTQMVCGHFTFRDGADHPILRALPDYLITTASDRAREPWLDEILRLITRRVFDAGPGSTAAVTRLSEAMFIELMRVGVHQCPNMARILSAFHDKQIGRTLKVIHDEPHGHWTVESLATEAGMSRSRFAEKFRSLIGMSPMAYLSEWRLQKALALLDETRTSVQEVAVKTGYQSPAAFTRAFAGKFGVAPTEYRRNMH